MDAVDEGMAEVLRAIGEALVGDPVERDLQAVSYTHLTLPTILRV